MPAASTSTRGDSRVTHWGGEFSAFRLVPVWVARTLFFARSQFSATPGNRPLTHGRRPLRRHGGWSFVLLGIGKGPASCPVGDFGDSSGGPIDFGALVTSRRFALQPWVDGGATEVENLARFALLLAIELERLTPLLTAVIAVRVGPGRLGSV